MSMRILIVDHDRSFLEEVRELLEPRGHLVVNETDPNFALERARRWRPDLVMVSAELEACSQGDMLERLRQLRPAPAVLLTSHLDRFDLAWQAWQKGGDELLLKPILQPSQLQVAMMTALQNALCPRRQIVELPQAAAA